MLEAKADVNTIRKCVLFRRSLTFNTAREIFFIERIVMSIDSKEEWATVHQYLN